MRVAIGPVGHIRPIRGTEDCSGTVFRRGHRLASGGQACEQGKRGAEARGLGSASPVELTRVDHEINQNSKTSSDGARRTIGDSLD